MAFREGRLTQAVFATVENLYSQRRRKIMSDVVWSVNILLGIGLLGVIWCIYKILIWDNEENNSSDTHTH